jgi:hypothetical protein
MHECLEMHLNTCVHLDVSGYLWANVHHYNWTTIEQKYETVWKVRTDIILFLTSGK